MNLAEVLEVVDRPLSSKEIADVGLQVAEQLAKQHQTTKQPHKDIRFEVIVLDKSGVVSLLPATGEAPAFEAPENEDLKHFSTAGDVYSLGNLLIQDGLLQDIA